MADNAKDTKLGSTPDAPEFQDEIQAEMAEIKSNLAALTKTLAKYGKTRADGLQDRAAEWSDDLMAESRQAVKKLRKQVSRLEADVETNVRNHPLQWFFGALGLGLVVAMLVRRTPN